MKCKYAVEVKNLSFSYSSKTKTIDNVSLKIPQGKYVAILGHNGSGKSTLSKLLLGILIPASGNIKIMNLPIFNKKEIRNNNLGVIFQNPDNQFIGNTVKDDIAFGLENKCTPREEMLPIILKYAQRVGMENFLDSEPHKLSGGQKQRVAIASILALEYPVILFDESTSMLDPQAKMSVKKLMREICDNEKKTVISITHDMDEAQQADYIFVMYQGKLIKMGTPKEIFKDYENLKKWSLNMPFNVKVSYEIQKLNKNFEPKFSEGSLVRALCKLK